MESGKSWAAHPVFLTVTFLAAVTTIVLGARQLIGPMYGDSDAASRKTSSGVPTTSHHVDSVDPRPIPPIGPNAASPTKPTNDPVARAESLRVAEDTRRKAAAVAALSSDYDQLKSRFTAIEKSLGERERNMDGLTLRPEIRSTLETTRADLAAAALALSREDTAVASQRLDRARSGLKYLEAL